MKSNFYARLVKLYPEAYRERFKEEMLQVFEDMYAARQSAFRFWSRFFGTRCLPPSVKI